jgi:hypothetical protein
VGTALTNFHELVTELGGDSHALVADAHIPTATSAATPKRCNGGSLPKRSHSPG